MAKNRNRDRSKPQHRTPAQGSEDQKSSMDHSSERDSERPIPGSSEHVPKGREKKFGHN